MSISASAVGVAATDAPASFCGIDVAKRKHQALFLDAGGRVTKPSFAVANDRAGFDLLLGALGELPGPVTVALEATGHYWLSLYEALAGRGHRTGCSCSTRCRSTPTGAAA